MAWTWVLSTSAFVLLALLAVSGRYGYDRDELYFIEAGRHLAFGYPDQPLLTPLLASTMNTLAPRSLLMLRFPAALAAVVSVVSAGLIAREIGGGRRAQAVAMCCCAAAPIILAISHFLTTTTLDLAFTSVLCWLFVRLLRTENDRLWVVMGAVLGVGLLNKLIVGALMLAIVASIAAVGPRGLLRSRWALLGGALALLGVLPYLGWQIAHGLPQLEVAHNQASSGEFGGRAGFLPFQLVFVGPLLVPVWLAGLVGLIRAESWCRYRCFGVAYLVLVAVMLAVSGKAYYVVGFYPLLFGFGAVPMDRWLDGSSRVRVWVLGAAVTITAAIGTLLGLSVLPEDRLAGSIVLKLNTSAGEMVGWPRFTKTVAAVYRGLPPNIRARTAIFTLNYGEAGAIDLYGPARGLPQAYSGHNGFAEWGPPPNSDTSVVVVGEGLGAIERRDFLNCQVKAHINNGVGVNNQEQGGPVWFCPAERQPWSELWAGLRHFD